MSHDLNIKALEAAFNLSGEGLPNLQFVNDSEVARVEATALERAFDDAFAEAELNEQVKQGLPALIAKGVAAAARVKIAADPQVAGLQAFFSAPASPPSKAPPASVAPSASTPSSSAVAAAAPAAPKERYQLTAVLELGEMAADRVAEKPAAAPAMPPRKYDMSLQTTVAKLADAASDVAARASASPAPAAAPAPAPAVTLFS